MRALRFFASMSAVLLWSLTGCSLVLDTDPPDPVGQADLGFVDFDSGRRDLGTRDLGTADAGAPPIDGGDVDAGCTSSAECQDDVFCNGTEQCIDGACVTTELVACSDSDGVACTHPTCDATLDACVETPLAALCAAGEYCDAVEGCRTPPACMIDTDCVSTDPCTFGACEGDSCVFRDVDCSTVLDPLAPDDCRVISCDRALGCVYTPVDLRCDDLVGCTVNSCRTDGSCRFEPNPDPCNDGADCTADVCDPSYICGAPSSPQSGCRHAPSNSRCAEPARDVIALFPGLACATPVCLGAPAMNASGCGFEGGCAAGQTCITATATCSAVAFTRACTSDDACNDGNPCNGSETCASTSGGSRVCAASLTSPCQSTPKGPTLDGTCALSTSAAGGLAPICALRVACAVAP